MILYIKIPKYHNLVNHRSVPFLILNITRLTKFSKTGRQEWVQWKNRVIATIVFRWFSVSIWNFSLFLLSITSPRQINVMKYDLKLIINIKIMSSSRLVVRYYIIPYLFFFIASSSPITTTCFNWHRNSIMSVQ